MRAALVAAMPPQPAVHVALIGSCGSQWFALTTFSFALSPVLGAYQSVELFCVLHIAGSPERNSVGALTLATCAVPRLLLSTASSSTTAATERRAAARNAESPPAL